MQHLDAVYHTTVTIHTASHMYMPRQTRHGTRPRLGLGLEFAYGRACASLLTFFIHTAGRVYNISHIILGRGHTKKCAQCEPLLPALENELSISPPSICWVKACFQNFIFLFQLMRICIYLHMCMLIVYYYQFV